MWIKTTFYSRLIDIADVLIINIISCALFITGIGMVPEIVANMQVANQATAKHNETSKTKLFWQALRENWLLSVLLAVIGFSFAIFMKWSLRLVSYYHLMTLDMQFIIYGMVFTCALCLLSFIVGSLHVLLDQGKKLSVRNWLKQMSELSFEGFFKGLAYTLLLIAFLVISYLIPIFLLLGNYGVFQLFEGGVAFAKRHLMKA